MVDTYEEEYTAGQMRLFLVKRTFVASGKTEVKLQKGLKVLFDGTTAEVDGKTYELPVLYTALRVNWMAPIYEVGDRVEVFGVINEPETVWRAEVTDVNETMMGLKLLDGASIGKGVTSFLIPLPSDGPIPYTRIKRLSRPVAAATRLCSTCRRDADVGRPCWWCGTQVM